MFALFRSKKRNKKIEPDIRYGDPSHDQSKWKKQVTSPADSSPSQQIKSHQISKNSYLDAKEILTIISNTHDIESIALKLIQDSGSNGCETTPLNKLILSKVLNNKHDLETAIKSKTVTNKLHSIRVKLSKKGDIGFNSIKRVWYPEKDKIRKLTEKENHFLQNNGINTEGWVNITNKLEAVKWLHKNLSDDEFEKFCCVLLEHSLVENVHVSEKRQSGADGGLDGTGEYTLGGSKFPIIFEAKRYALERQVGEDICAKLIGVMMREKVKHAFIITTATFAKRAKEYVEKVCDSDGYQIEFIDQDRMAEIMIEKKDAPHGLGLHRTEKNFIYMNIDILKNTIQNEKI